MKKSIILLLALFLIVSCSEDNSGNADGDYSISGKFLTPNGIDAVSKATVKLFRGNTEIKQTITDSEGNFTLNGVNTGDYEVKISKGLFSASRSITLDDIFDIDLSDISITEFPNIAVVTGAFDNIEGVLYNLGLVNPITQEPLFDIIEGNNILDRSHNVSHTHGTMSRPDNPILEPNVDFTFADFIESPDLMDDYDIIFLNCGLSESKTDFGNNITDYVANGGLLYSTDYAFVYLNDITNNGEDYIDFYEPYRTGDSLSTEAEILNNDLIDWLELNFNITIVDNNIVIDEFLPGWQVVDSYDENTVLPWLNGLVDYNGLTDNKDLAFTFLHGDGGVFYSSFHTENNTEEDSNVARLIQYMVFELADLK
ncbi:carboxypeptidase-like regulatory domain-containing protein [Winogradskyella sp.]|uniref:carboxypeptidase-like regulatory domain-containing protein n=1 Tax=Winogradskyella sp. TaxID=1883156 RepID=UPI003F6CD727